MQKFIDRALVVLKIFSVHSINLFWLTMTFQNFEENPCFICLGTYYSINSFYQGFLKLLLYVSFLRIEKVFNETFAQLHSGGHRKGAARM